MNAVIRERKVLAQTNYVLKANSTTDYWFGLSKNKIESYKNAMSGAFNIIIFGNSERESDYYVIPFRDLQDLLIPENLPKRQDTAKLRWVGDIKNHIFRIRNSSVERNIGQCYSLPLPSFLGGSSSFIVIDDESINDYAIENARREISVRIHQSKFRKHVIANFNSKCCLTGVGESDLLVASHIVPWADRSATRLDPKNGLSLYVLYDRMFDKGYFTLDEGLKVKITSRLKELSPIVQRDLISIHGMKISNPTKFPISKDCLKYHRETIFEKK